MVNFANLGQSMCFKVLVLCELVYRTRTFCLSYLNVPFLTKNDRLLTNF